MKTVFLFNEDNLSDYEKGFIAGITLFAWWKDGEQYVGTCGKTLSSAINEFLTERGHTAQPVVYP